MEPMLSVIELIGTQGCLEMDGKGSDLDSLKVQSLLCAKVLVIRLWLLVVKVFTC